MANPLGVLMANILSPQIVGTPTDVRFLVQVGARVCFLKDFLNPSKYSDAVRRKWRTPGD